MGFDIHLIANFAALAMITIAGPAVIFILFYRRGALSSPRFRDEALSPDRLLRATESPADPLPGRCHW